MKPKDSREKENAEKTEAEARRRFPDEEWMDAQDVKFTREGKGYEIPPDLRNIKIAGAKIKEKDELALAKEIRQAHILAKMGYSVYLLPKTKDPVEGFVKGPDAVVNGEPCEFKTVEGKIRRVEERFWDSRMQSDNVYIRVANPNITKGEVLEIVKKVLNHRAYSGTTKGWLILTLDGTGATHKFSIRGLK
ncbi:MAG: hypothetical protein FWG66_16020 [Spirochaetes bacterium]|nr:hypothetical protein [Spirochaetota bacterium]